MGSLSLKKQNISRISILSGGTASNFFIFLGGSNNTIGTFLNSAELTGNNIASSADRIAVIPPSGIGFVIYFLRADGITWRIQGTNITSNDVVIQNGSIIQLLSPQTKTFTMQGTNVLQKLNSGKLSLGKQNISRISVIANIPSSDFIFLGGSNNTISTFLNSAELTGNNNSFLADRINIFDVNLQSYLNYFLRGDGVTWRSSQTGTSSQNNTIIPNNSRITLTSASNKTFTMQGTNIVQKLNSGKLSLGKQNYKILKDGEVYIFLGGSNNTISTFLNNSETVFGGSGIGTEILVYNSQNNNYDIYLRRTSTSWRDGNNVTVNNLVIQPNSRIFIQRSLTGNVTVQGTNIIQKYY